MVNPYESRSSLPGEDEPWTLRRLMVLVCWCYPVILIAAFYGTWALAGIILGHLPQPSLDDPKSIHFVVSVSCYLCAFLLVMFPWFAIRGAIGELFPKNDFPPRPAWRATSARPAALPTSEGESPPPPEAASRPAAAGGMSAPTEPAASLSGLRSSLTTAGPLWHSRCRCVNPPARVPEVQTSLSDAFS